MNLLKFAEIYRKLAVEEITTEEFKPDTATVNHAIRVEQQSQILSDMVDAGIQIGTLRPESRSYARNLNVTAVRYRTGLQQGMQPDELLSMYQQMMQYFNTLADRYIDENYDPMKQIKESLAYLSQIHA